MKIEIPEDVGRILMTLQEAGYEAYTVGGCTRDSIMGRKPADWDITTSALPAQVKALFPRTIDTGIRHGTVTVMIGSSGYEVTTYRIDGEYLDGRHPDHVVYTRSLAEDLRRRDFTINAMAYNPAAGLVDLFGGLEDIKNRRIRCVGDPRARFGEDALRMMRAVRFAAQLDFAIEEETGRAAAQLAGTLTRISAERIRTELEKLLLSPHPEWIQAAESLGITAVVLPEFDALARKPSENPAFSSARDHVLALLQHTEPDKAQRFAALLLYQSRNQADGIMRRLKFDNAARILTGRLVSHHAFSFANTEKEMRRFLHETGADLFLDLVHLRRADITAGGGPAASEAIRDLERKEALFQKVMEEGQCFDLDRLAVTGTDLMAAGIRPGRQLGDLLQALLEAVIEEPALNEKETLVRLATSKTP